MEPLVEFETDLSIHAIRMQKILVPTDFSRPSQNALRYALRFAKEFGAEVTLLHVLEKAPPIGGMIDVPPQCAYADESLTTAEKNLEALIASPRAAGFRKLATVVREGDAAHEIVETAQDSGTDLIVIATHGHAGLKRVLLGSTVERVIRAAPCPVFVVREKEHEFI